MPDPVTPTRGGPPWWTWLLVGAAVVALGGGAVLLAVSGRRHADAGRQAFPMSSIDYQSVVVGPVSYLDLRHDFAGKVIVLQYMSAGCAACRSEVPELVRTYQRFRDRGVQVIGVSLSTSRAATRAMIARLGIDYPVYLDKDGSAARQRFHVSQVPATLVYRNGRLLERFGSGLSGSELAAYLATLTAAPGG